MFIFHKDTTLEDLGNGVTRRILAHDGKMMAVEVNFAAGAVGPNTTTVLPARLRYERIGEPRFTSSLVPETKITGENATCLRRSRFAVVEPHSRSARPDTIASIRVSEVTGSHFTASSRPISSPIASATLRQG